MALQTSGMISLNDIHIEAGGTTGTTVSLNDSDLRGLTAASGYTINGTSGTSIDFGDFYGASGITLVDTQTLTVGYLAAGQYTSESYGYDGYIWMYGSISDGTANWLSGNEYRLLSWANNSLSLTVEGTNSNAGFISMIINGVTRTRTSATYSWTGTSGGRTWSWSASTNPLGANGASVTVQFT
jgi:hypothetical protein|tara:strand:- start:774 stop:1325 length:552 start_codon:yes stop_codon:yes gene_type:complete